MSTVPTQRPRTVTIAVIMLFAMMVMGNISSFYLQTHYAALKSMEARMPHMGAFQNVLLVLSLILNLFLEYKIFIGRNWARITALVIFVMAVLFSIPTFLGMFPWPVTFKVLGGLAMLVQGVAYTMLFTGAGNAWFKSRKKLARETRETGEIESGRVRSGAMAGTHASHFMRVVYPKLIGYGALGVAAVCIAWTTFMVWETCRMLPRIVPPYTCSSKFAVTMLLRQYWLLMAYAVLSLFTGICLLTRRAWAKWLAVAYLVISIVYLAGDISWSIWGLLHDKAMLGDQMVDLAMWVAGGFAAVLSVALVFLAIVMTRVPWPPRGKGTEATELA